MQRTYKRLDRCLTSPRVRAAKAEASTQDRMRRYYRAHRRSSWINEHGIDYLWHDMARRWGRRITEIKHICRPDRYPAPVPRSS
jgi:hypothetical protein